MKKLFFRNLCLILQSLTTLTFCVLIVYGAFSAMEKGISLFDVSLRFGPSFAHLVISFVLAVMVYHYLRTTFGSDAQLMPFLLLLLSLLDVRVYPACSDALVAAMEAHGLSGIIVNLGGNVAVSGTKPTGDPWRVGIRDPRDPSQLIGAVPLVAGSAVTSGVYERCFTAPDGTFYYHILDPRTGRPVETDVAGVTVICEKSIDAEGFSTTLLALGLERGLALARRHPEILQAFFIAPDGTITNAR